MILADKIIENRKKNGWSQEELAEKLGVSRQSVSKWESAQAIPDMKKILQLSEVFGVSTDYLMKDEIEEKPDLIILDPPRDGVHPKALPKILGYGVEQILYISCKPTSLARDIPAFTEAGYRPVRGISVDQFPWTANVETIVLFSKT